MRAVYGFISILLFCVGACAATTWQTMPLPTQAFDNETIDYGLPPIGAIRTAPYEGPTPLKINGASTIVTGQLRDMMVSAHPPLVIDVLGGNQTMTLPTAVLLPGAGVGATLTDAVQQRFAQHLVRLTGGDMDRAIVLFCLSKTCWLSHNAALRAVRLGYRHVLWYRGGRAAWTAAHLPLVPVQPLAW